MALLKKLLFVVSALFVLTGQTNGQSCQISDRKLICNGNLNDVKWDSINGKGIEKIEIDGASDFREFADSLPEMGEAVELRVTSSLNVRLPAPDHLPQIAKISLTNCSLTNAQVEDLLNPWIGLDLTNVKLPGNKLTVYPKVLNSLEKLEKVTLSENNITSFGEMVHFRTAVKKIDVSGNKIETMPSASMFHGNFSAAKLVLGGNPLFKSNVNAHVLQALAEKFEKVDLGEVDCSQCFFAALVRNKIELLTSTKLAGTCIGNKLRFDHLKSSDFPAKKCPTSSGSRASIALSLSLLLVFTAFLFV